MDLMSQLLRKKRQEKGLQQKDMAYALNISPPAYSNYENGKTKISVDMAQRFAEVLQIPVSELMESKSGNIEIKNVSNSAVHNENSTIHMQNDKLIESHLKQSDQILKISEQMILVMQNQNELFKEMTKIIKRY